MRFSSRLPFLRPRPHHRWWLIGSLITIACIVSYLIFAVSQLGALRDLDLLRLTGFPGSRDHLVIFQNDAERRPTGGFITSYAVLKFRFGLPLLTFGDVYDPRLLTSGGPSFPDPMVARMLASPTYPGHGFRDGNFDPDFPTAARELIRLYRAGYPDATFDGVIALDNTAFARLIDAVGGVTVDDVTFRSDIFFHQIEEIVQTVDTHDEAALTARKNVLGSLAKRLIVKALFSPTRYVEVAQSLVRSLDSRHALLYFADTTLQTNASQKSWTGALPFVTDRDMLAVVEGNYGGMKSSRYITRDASYDVALTQGRGAMGDEHDAPLTALAHLRIVLMHRGEDAPPISGYYKSLWRVYVPLGSHLIAGHVDRVADDGLRTVFTVAVDMHPRETRIIDLTYDLPDSVTSGGAYRLRLTRQAGSADDPLRVTLAAPAGFIFAKSNETDIESLDTREGLAVWSGVPRGDETIGALILPDTTPPRTVDQFFIGELSTMRVVWNEPLDVATIRPTVFTLTDRDVVDGTTDTIAVIDARLIDARTIELTVAGISPNCRERYDLAIAGIADRHGNIANRTVTVVQAVDATGAKCVAATTK